MCFFSDFFSMPSFPWLQLVVQNMVIQYVLLYTVEELQQVGWVAVNWGKHNYSETPCKYRVGQPTILEWNLDKHVRGDRELKQIFIAY